MEAGQLLGGRYRLDALIGTGGMSAVWRADDQVLGRAVAVKVLDGVYAADPLSRHRILAEAKAAARLSHPNVTNVFDYGESADSLPFVVMELLPGPTLAQRLAAGPLAPAAALRVCAEVAAGLAAAHAQGLVHRDVKPANVVLTPGGAKVVDFGIAAVAGHRETDPHAPVLGTPAYLAPERLAGEEVQPASDVYALGLLVHRALTNKLPWHTETTTQMLMAHVYVEPAPLPLLPGVPAEVVDLCRRCLAKEPGARPSAEEAATALARAAAGASDVVSWAAVTPAEAPEEPLADLPTEPVDGTPPATSPRAESPRAESQPAGQPPAGSPPARRRRALVAAVVAGVVAVPALAWAVGRSDERTPDAGAAPGGAGSGAVTAATLGPGEDPSAALLPGPGPARSGGASGQPTAGPAGGPAPTPGPTRQTATGEPSPGASGGTGLDSPGGTVVATCVGPLALIRRTAPAPGYRTVQQDGGAARVVRVVFRSATDADVTVDVECDLLGLPVATVRLGG